MNNEQSIGIDQPAGPDDRVEQERFVQPELAVEMRSDILAALSEQFPDQREMFERFSQLPPMEFKPGRVHYIFGPNGSGKSTLANAIYLAASVEHTAGRILRRPEFGWRSDGSKPISPEDARMEAFGQVLRPSNQYAIAELISMASSPRIVQEGAMAVTKFQAREGYGDDPDLRSDTPIVHRIAVQDLLGEKRAGTEDTIYGKMALAGMYGVTAARGETSYVEHGASARQMIEVSLRREFQNINPGSIVVLDETAFGLSPKRQQEYVAMLEQIAREKNLIIIAPENSSYAYDLPSERIDLENPQAGLHLSQDRTGFAQAEVVPVETQEDLPESSLEFAINYEIIAQLADENPQYKPMLEAFAQLPPTISFGPGKTEIFADNGGGKTTILGTMYFLAKIEESIQSIMEMTKNLGRPVDRDSTRREVIRDLVSDPSQPSDQILIESMGLARRLIQSGAVTLSNAPTFPKTTFDDQGIENIMWINLLDISGEIKQDNYNIIGRSNSEDIDVITKKINQWRPERVKGSTRQTAESKLASVIQGMPEGGFLFIDEIDGGISPGRQLLISEKIHELAKQRKITLISTSNSYDGYKYRLTPSLDLSKPEQGIIKATHKRVESQEASQASV